MELGAGLVVDTCKQIEAGTATRQVQDESKELKPAPKIHKGTCRIDWNASIEDIYNHIRGLSPYPGAWTKLVNDGKADQMKIFKTKMEQAEHDYNVGKLVVAKKSLKVAVKEGYISLLELQLPGKRRMQIMEVLNGLNLDKEAHLR